MTEIPLKHLTEFLPFVPRINLSSSLLHILPLKTVKPYTRSYPPKPFSLNVEISLFFNCVSLNSDSASKLSIVSFQFRSIYCCFYAIGFCSLFVFRESLVIIRNVENQFGFFVYILLSALVCMINLVNFRIGSRERETLFLYLSAKTLEDKNI